jgi:hypothetical protein
VTVVNTEGENASLSRHAQRLATAASDGMAGQRPELSASLLGASTNPASAQA